MSKQNEEHVELSSSSSERLDLLYKNLNFISKAYYSSEGIFPFWESVYALIVGQLIIAYFNVNNDSGKILILVAGLIFSFCWARIVSLSYQYSKYRVKRMERLEDEIENIYGDVNLSFYKGSPKKDQKKGKLHSTWFYRRILPIILIVFWIFLAIIFSLLPILASAAPDEASGVVTNVVDGDTFDLRIEKTDPRIINEIERVRLADVDSPEMSTPEGEPAKVYTTETLLGKKVWLDIDDKSKDWPQPPTAGSSPNGHRQAGRTGEVARLLSEVLEEQLQFDGEVEQMQVGEVENKDSLNLMWRNKHDNQPDN